MSAQRAIPPTHSLAPWAEIVTGAVPTTDVASPSQDAADMAAKVRVYLRGGTRLVWVVWPERQAVDVWRPCDLRSDAATMRPSATLGTEGALDGEDVVPGFRAPLARILRRP